MKNLYLFQFSRVYDGQVYLPLAVGMLWAYARTIPAIRESYEARRFIVLREPPAKIVAELEQPDVAAFSAYGWNWEMSLATAKQLKETYPQCLVVFGGPQIPSRPAEVAALFERYPFIDVTVHGEGEITFAELLVAHANETSLTAVHGLSVGGQMTPPRDRARELDQFPSPYLEGLFADLLADRRYKWQATWETNRGCPYHCTFCDWGGLQGTKLFSFGLDRLRREIEWFGANQIEYVYGADANFGIFERDIELARHLARTKIASGGYPDKFRGNYAKNHPGNVLEIAKILHRQGLNKSISIAVQSMDKNTLTLIKRRNMKFDTLAGYVRQYRRLGIATFTEVIIGMPGETYETFERGIDELIGAGFHDAIDIYNCAVFPNAEMSDPSYASAHGLSTRRIPQFLRYCDPRGDPVQEYEDIIVATSTMSIDDFKRSVMYAWIVQLCHSMNLTTVIAVYFGIARGVAPSRFYEALLEFAGGHPQTMIGQLHAAVRAHTEQWVDHGAPRDLFVPDVCDVTLDAEQYAFLHIARDFERFFAELDDFLQWLERRGLGLLDPSLRADLLNLQAALVVKWDRSGTTTLALGHSLYGFFEAATCGEAVPLRKGAFEVAIVDPYDFDGDMQRYAREIVMWGRRDGKTRYHSVTETERRAVSHAR